ncbi:uncharacterized protein DUF2510 [Paramicrobacterium agarici]|nr:uncharacterized protein DUF2510 [Microbacterium agarici]
MDASPGWYTRPDDHSLEGYWDGDRWTAERPASPQSDAFKPRPTFKSNATIISIVVLPLLLIWGVLAVLAPFSAEPDDTTYITDTDDNYIDQPSDGNGGYGYRDPYYDDWVMGEDGTGYYVRCRDGTHSKSGGRQGACSHHGGVAG